MDFYTRIINNEHKIKSNKYKLTDFYMTNTFKSGEKVKLFQSGIGCMFEDKEKRIHNNINNFFTLRFKDEDLDDDGPTGTTATAGAGGGGAGAVTAVAGPTAGVQAGATATQTTQPTLNQPIPITTTQPKTTQPTLIKPTKITSAAPTPAEQQAAKLLAPHQTALNTAAQKLASLSNGKHSVKQVLTVLKTGTEQQIKGMSPNKKGDKVIQNLLKSKPDTTKPLTPPSHLTSSAKSTDSGTPLKMSDLSTVVKKIDFTEAAQPNPKPIAASAPPEPEDIMKDYKEEVLAVSRVFIRDHANKLEGLDGLTQKEQEETVAKILAAPISQEQQIKELEDARAELLQKINLAQTKGGGYELLPQSIIKGRTVPASFKRLPEAEQLQLFNNVAESKVQRGGVTHAQKANVLVQMIPIIIEAIGLTSSMNSAFFNTVLARTSIHKDTKLALILNHKPYLDILKTNLENKRELLERNNYGEQASKLLHMLNHYSTVRSSKIPSTQSKAPEHEITLPDELKKDLNAFYETLDKKSITHLNLTGKKAARVRKLYTLAQNDELTDQLQYLQPVQTNKQKKAQFETLQGTLQTQMAGLKFKQVDTAVQDIHKPVEETEEQQLLKRLAELKKKP